MVRLTSNQDSVDHLLIEAGKIASETNNSWQKLNIMVVNGLKEYYSNNYSQALELYYQALSQAEQEDFTDLIAKLNHNIGMLYDEIEEYDEAIKYFNNSLKISFFLKDTALIAKTYQNMAISFQNKKDLERALKYNDLAYQLAETRKDTAMIIDLTNNYGTIAYNQKKLDESLDFYKKALDLYVQVNDKKGIAFSYNNIGLAYLDKKEYPKSYHYFEKSLKLANELKMYDFTGDIYGNLTFYYEEMKDYKNAYLSYDKYNSVLDSLSGDKKSRMVKEIQAKYQLIKNQRDLEELKLKNQSQLQAIDNAKIRLFFLISVTLFVILLMVVMIYLLLKEKRLAGELKEKTTELHELNISKDKFFSIIAHDLKNPFNILVSYTSILKTDIDLFSKDELNKIIADLNQAAENGYNLLQNLLLWTRSQTNRIHIYKTKFNLTECLINIKGLVELNLQAKDQQLHIEIEPDFMVYADKEMISTVLRNLVFNAVKFSPKGSEIKVIVSTDNLMAKIEVVDYGVGISEEGIKNIFILNKSVSSAGTEGEPGTGLGLVICKEFVEKNNGEIWVNSREGEGSVFSFTIPLEPITS
ncbi:MAG: tetratricopeptide repeat-containing sensor histidine kinase [Prolixibacteraceae bacterium]